jgi:hypothetical protein
MDFMQSEGNDRVQEIRSKVLAERGLVSTLAGQISDSGLKQQLQQASDWLDEVEDVFLQSAVQEPRSPDALSRWLSHAELPLQWAVQRRKKMQEIVATYGSNAQSMPGS